MCFILDKGGVYVTILKSTSDLLIIIYSRCSVSTELLHFNVKSSMSIMPESLSSKVKKHTIAESYHVWDYTMKKKIRIFLPIIV